MKNKKWFTLLLIFAFIITGCSKGKLNPESNQTSPAFSDENLAEEDPTSYLGISIRPPKAWKGFVNFDKIVPHYIKETTEGFSPFIAFYVKNISLSSDEYVAMYVEDLEKIYKESDYKLISQEPFTTTSGLKGQKITISINNKDNGLKQVLFNYIFENDKSDKDKNDKSSTGDYLIVYCADLESNIEEAAQLFDASVSSIKPIDTHNNLDRKEYSEADLNANLGAVYEHQIEMTEGVTAPLISIRPPLDWVKKENVLLGNNITFYNPQNDNYQANISLNYSTFPKKVSLLDQIRNDRELQNSFYEKYGFKLLYVKSFVTTDGINVGKLITSYSERGINGEQVDIIHIHYLVGSSLRQKQGGSNSYFDYNLDISCKVTAGSLEDVEKMCDMSVSTLIIK